MGWGWMAIRNRTPNAQQFCPDSYERNFRRRCLCLSVVRPVLKRRVVLPYEPCGGARAGFGHDCVSQLDGSRSERSGGGVGRSGESWRARLATALEHRRSKDGGDPRGFDLRLAFAACICRTVLPHLSPSPFIFTVAVGRCSTSTLTTTSHAGLRRRVPIP